MTSPTILAFDTSGPHIAAGLWPSPVAPVFLDMKKGQAERLVPVCQDLLEEAGLSMGDLDAIAVGVGPGNFTGIRIAVSAARGMALGLGIPAVGITGFEWLHQGYAAAGRLMLALPAPQDRVYVQTFVNGAPLSPPGLLTPGERDPVFEQPNLIVAGYRASEIARAYDAEHDDRLWEDRRPQMMANTLALIATNKLAAAGGAWAERPAPLYIRPADAAPSRHTAPKIIG